MIKITENGVCQMIKSMTGFGRCLLETEQYRILAELKAVNHRYCEVSVRMPKKLGFFEPNVRSLLKEYAERGKIDVFIVYEDFTKKNECVRYNHEIAKGYMNCIQSMAEEFGIENDIKASMLSRMPEVLTLEEQETDEKELWSALEPVLRNAFSQFVQTREAEGTRLCNDILLKLDSMEQAVSAIEERSPQIVSEYRARLTAKVNELLGDSGKVDDAALATEIVIFADKLCVDEETVRLKSHIVAMRDAISKFTGDGIGRKLDFVAQEMNREANTILSKANDRIVSDYAIGLKTDIEIIREQIQNIE